MRFSKPSKTGFDLVTSPWPTTLAGVLIALCLLGAELAESLLRKGNAAYENGDFQTALSRYQAAEEATLDPGLVAFNEAAALYQLGQYQEAADHYRCCREDAQDVRAFRAQYGQATCWLQLARMGEWDDLDEAIVLFEHCLTNPVDESLLPDVKHNLELARRLREQNPAERQRQDASSRGQNRDRSTQPPGPLPTEMGDPNAVPPSAGKGQRLPRNRTATDPQQSDDQPPPGKGNIPPVPDSDELLPLTPEEAFEHLRQQAERIRTETRQRRATAAIILHRKDW